MIFEVWKFPVSKTNKFETDININGTTMSFDYRYDLPNQRHLISLSQNGLTLTDLEPKSMMPLNYSAKNIHDFMVIPVSSFDTNPLCKETEFTDYYVNSDNEKIMLWNWFLVDNEGYNYLLNEYLKNKKTK